LWSFDFTLRDEVGLWKIQQRIATINNRIKL